MKGLILNKGEDGYSYFKDLFCEIAELSEKYNWFVSYPECYPQSQELQQKLNMEPLWLSGAELKDLLYTEDFQWIWGVLSGFPKNILLDDVLNQSSCADGGLSFWQNPIHLQHPLAEIELVAWDSSCTLFISKEDSMIEKISALYCQAEDLEAYNSQQ